MASGWLRLLPSKCPACKRDLEYQVTIEMIDPPIGKIDTGYCAACACLFESVRQAGAYYETAWPPVCRACRQPVVFGGVEPSDPEGTAVYHCAEHERERWTWSRGRRRWARSGDR